MGRWADAPAAGLLEMNGRECIDFLIGSALDGGDAAEVALETLRALDSTDRYFVLLGCLSTARQMGAEEEFRGLWDAAMGDDEDDGHAAKEGD